MVGPLLQKQSRRVPSGGGTDSRGCGAAAPGGPAPGAGRCRAAAAPPRQGAAAGGSGGTASVPRLGLGASLRTAGLRSTAPPQNRRQRPESRRDGRGVSTATARSGSRRAAWGIGCRLDRLPFARCRRDRARIQLRGMAERGSYIPGRSHEQGYQSPVPRHVQLSEVAGQAGILSTPTGWQADRSASMELGRTLELLLQEHQT
ncbi:uncharacterized protein LOC134415014 [Melospiza melodia melodia]|uniref:uncharacterized protein LOC134415014 n=1 Tax=Melospiza melodia melodia TaxID=1914991 RepID=UPI002FD010EE